MYMLNMKNNQCALRPTVLSNTRHVCMYVIKKQLLIQFNMLNTAKYIYLLANFDRSTVAACGRAISVNIALAWESPFDGSHYRIGYTNRGYGSSEVSIEWSRSWCGDGPVCASISIHGRLNICNLVGRCCSTMWCIWCNKSLAVGDTEFQSYNCTKQCLVTNSFRNG